MSDDVTKPFGGAPSLSPRYGRGSLTINEFVQRVFHAEVQIRREGDDPRLYTVIVNPTDLQALRLEARRALPDEVVVGFYDNPITEQDMVRGLPVKGDSLIAPRQIVLRKDVAA